MQDRQSDLINKMYEFNLWANTQLIELCAGLEEEQLEAEVDGVYGRIRPTLTHLIRSEGGYVRRLSGSPFWAEDLEWNDVPWSELLERAQLSGSKLLAIAAAADPSIRHIVEVRGEPYHFFNWTVLLQALYHAIEHRTQVKVMLTKAAVPHPNLAAWDFVETLTSE
jgi:uncharacterized damage-inducible protein DinB